MPPELTSLLDGADSRLAPENALTAMRCLAHGLRSARAVLGPASWTEAAEQARQHPLAERLREDPLTFRVLDRPRGYPGDAVALDLIYGGLPASPERTTTRLGQAIFAYTAGCSAPAVAVRQRRSGLAQAIDEAAAAVKGARILAVGCGHLREARQATALASRGLGELVALDSDPDALRVVRLENAAPVRTLMGSPADVAAGRLDLDDFDLIYAAGLYERLDDGEATALTGALLRALAPGGRLLVSSFVDGFFSQEYMQAFMNWTLRCRDEPALLALLEAAGADPALQACAWRDATGCLAWLDATRPE